MTYSKLESIIKSFPLIFVILTTIGYINLQFYYYFFGIEIINYLEISQILLLFFNKSILIILLLLSIITFIYLIDDEISQEVSNKEKLIQKEQKTKKIIFKGGSVIIILTLIYIIVDIISANYIGLIFPIGFLVLALINRIGEKTVLKTIVKKNDSLFSFIIYFGFQVLLLFNLLTISNSIDNGYRLRFENKQSKLICFLYNGKTIKTNNKTIYVGETKKFMFLFDKEKEETLIFKTEEINALKFNMKDN